MYIPFLNELLFLGLLSIFLLIVYRRVNYNIDFFSRFSEGYSNFSRKSAIKGYIKEISRKPADIQKGIFKESLILTTVLLVMFLVSAKAIFFTAVVSGSMVPTFDRGDLVLMQDIEHTYGVGDIIMFKSPDTANPESHRIVSITGNGIQTKGDAVGIVDPWTIQNKDVIGKAILIDGKPIVIKGCGRFFIIDYTDKNQDFGPFGDAQKYTLFFQLVKLYGYIIAVGSLLIYIALAFRQKRKKIDNEVYNKVDTWN